MLMGFGRATIDKTATEATAMLIGVNSDVQFALTDSCEYGRFSLMRSIMQMHLSL